MNNPINIVFDLGGVLFEYDVQRGTVDKPAIVPIKSGIALLKECAQEVGHPLFVCTNWSTIDPFMKEYPEITGLFKGIVTSGAAQAKKPSPQIYQYLLSRYELVAHHTIFIDDTACNIDAAQDAGMIGIHAYDLTYVRNELIRLGIL